MLDRDYRKKAGYKSGHLLLTPYEARAEKSWKLSEEGLGLDEMVVFEGTFLD